LRSAANVILNFSMEHPSEAKQAEEKQETPQTGDAENPHQQAATVEHTSAFKNLGILDRFLAVWILLAMIMGILLGNFEPETGRALQRGQFVGVSTPIGTADHLLCILSIHADPC
jgi:arsenite transporter